MTGALDTLLRIRKAAVDQGRTALADCLTTETAALDTLREIEIAIAKETETASEADAGDERVEDFARWLRRARQDRADAERALQAAEAGTLEARAVLAAAQAAMRAVESVIEARAAAEQAASMKAEQNEIDEIAGRG
jgi:flagellar export protein FliJ